MRKIFILMAKDVRRRLARPSTFLMNLAIPLVLAGLLSMVFGGDKAGFRMRLVLVDEDEGPVSMFMTGSTGNPMAAEHLEVIQAGTRDEGMKKLKDEEATALLIIPEGFSNGLLEGKKVELLLYKNPAQNVMPVVAQQGAEVVALYLSAARNGLGDEAQVLLKLFDGVGWEDSARLAVMITVLYGRVQATGEILFPPIIEIADADKAETETEAEGGGFDLMGWMFPGMLIMGLLFSSTTQMRDLLEEARLGTIRRILTAPVGTSQVLIAKILSVAIIVGLAHMIFLLTGSLVFGMSWGPLLPLAVVSLVLVLAATGFAAMVYSLATTQQQGDTFGGIVIMIMSLMGGAFFPVDVLPGGLKMVAMATLNYWANGSLRGLISGSSLEEIAPSLLGLTVVGTGFILVGMLVMKRRHLQGAF